MKLFKSTAFKSTAMALACAVLMPISAQADDWHKQVRMYLVEIETELESEGYSLLQKYHIDDMYEDSSKESGYYFEAGTEYIVVGACDNDCSDIDMWIYDENRNEIDDDVSDDDVPIVRVTPRRSGIFYVKTKMYNCDAGPCSFGHIIMTD